MRMIFNGRDLSQFLLVEHCSRSTLPEVELTTQDVSGMDGTQFVCRRLKPREIECQMLMRPLGMPVPEAARRLAAALSAPEPAPLILDDEPDKYYMAILSGATDLDSLWRFGGGTMTFYCPDPIAYSKDESSLASTGTKLEPEVGGTYPAWPVIAATPAANTSYWRLTNTATGQYVQLTYAFDGKKQVVVDMEAMHCTIGGANADQYVTLASDYWQMPAGEVCAMTASSGTSAVEWRDRWL